MQHLHGDWHSPDCGVKTGSDTLSAACKLCLDVPEGDIDSPLTHWVCACERCPEAHAELCQQRQLKRTIVRLASLQYQLAAAFASTTFLGSVQAYRDIPADDQIFARFNDGLPGRILEGQAFAVPAAKQTPIPTDLPEDVRLQACCIENCMDAIAFTSQALAYWTQGLSLRLREMWLKPRPVQHIVFGPGDDTFHFPAEHHTVLVVTPDSDHGASLVSGDQWCEDYWTAPSSFVLDPTCWQYDFKTHIEPTCDYLWRKVKETSQDHVHPFGKSFRRHEDVRERSSPMEQYRAMYREVCLRAMNNVIFQETQRWGGSQMLLGGGHDEFVQKQQELQDAVGKALADAREKADDVFFEDMEDSDSIVVKLMWSLVRKTTGIGHLALSDAFRHTRGA